MEPLFCHHHHFILPIITAIGSLLTAVVAGFLALWARQTVLKKRDFNTRLFIEEMKHTIYKVGDVFQVYIEVKIKNIGLVPVRTCVRFESVDGKSQPKKFVYKDKLEEVWYSVELQIKRLKESKITFDWYDKTQYDSIADHINLLSDLEDPDDPKKPSFYLEPNDEYFLGCWVQLDKGLYEAKVIWVGENSDDDFWHRRYPFIVG
jgi:hypothetical protein